MTCLKATGTIITKEYELEDFDSIVAFERLQLIVKDASEISVQLETGENLLEDFDVFVENNTLHIRNNGACNIARDYDTSKIYVSHPDLKQIRNSSGQTVLGDGILSWENLNLISDDLIEEDFYHKDGDFRLELDSENVLVQCNGLSNFFLSGTVTNLQINLLEGDSRLPLENLLVQNVILFHRGTNDILIAPQQSITGELRSTGNLILLNNPPVVDIEAYFTGEVIFD
ncbi:head GIN domain-containing protein [Dokdonia sp. Hel_I_53]|uniref:head GIN domain-containing protein n=1 Tax=Dokdonia sp. Hel_I_53 TaxID=1566287 RepID=UPI0016454451|nr:head GIN domain-containing protein [Dokdonia sp. Hel_I_53]